MVRRAALGFLALTACSVPETAPIASGPDAAIAPEIEKARVAGYFAGPADFSYSTIQREPEVGLSYAETSMPLRLVAEAWIDNDEEEEHERDQVMNPRQFRTDPIFDHVLQPQHPVNTMPATFRNFLGQGHTNSQATMSGTPPDTNGAVGPNHYVQ